MGSGWRCVNQNSSPSPEGVLGASLDQGSVEQKNGQIVRKARWLCSLRGRAGLSTAHRTVSGAAGLGDVFSTLHETPNETARGKSKCGASLIRPKRRCNDSLRLRSCRPKSSKHGFGSRRRLPPLRLLTHLEHATRQRVFRHAVPPVSESTAPPAPLPFSVQQSTEEKVPRDGLPHPAPALLQSARKKKYQKTGRPPDWRTRKAPFEGEWAQMTSWLLAHPERDIRRDLSPVGTGFPGTVASNPATNLAKGPQQAAYSFAGNV